MTFYPLVILHTSRKRKNSQGYKDNMVSVYNIGGSDEDIKKLDEKTIDLFLFVRAMTGKRLGLNKIAEALVNVSKTLTS